MSKEVIITNEEREIHKSELLKIGDGQIGRDIFHMLIARYRILYIRSCEEERVLDCLKHISLYDGLDLFRWDISRGLLNAHGEAQIAPADSEVHQSPHAALSHIIDEARSDHEKLKDKKLGKRGRVYVMLDIHSFLSGQPVLERRFKEFARISSITSIVIISPVFECPPSLNKEFTLIDFPYPSVGEIKGSLQKVISEIPADYPEARDVAKKQEEEIINAARGLTLVETENAYAKSLVKFKTFNIPTILDEKKQIIRKSGILEYCDPKVTFDEIGGLDDLKEWFRARRQGFTEDAKEYGLPIPRGTLLMGTPGCGKSLVCNALASEYKMPLLRLDMGSVFASHVGESEGRIRDMINIAESVSPCLLFLDEVEKGIGGVASSNQTDGGVTARVFGTLLTWMQEKTAAVFIVCTANNIRSIPQEFFRRFDEIFFLDLPNTEQRIDVVEKLLIKKKRDPINFDLDKIVIFTENYTPAEIEKGIDNALFVAYSDSRREVETDDIVSELQKFQPMYNARREEVDDMRRQALGEDGKGGMARRANSIVAKKIVKSDPENETRNINMTSDEL